MGLQIALSMDTTVSEKGILRQFEKSPGRCFQRVTSHRESQIHDGNAIYVGAADFIEKIHPLLSCTDIISPVITLCQDDQSYQTKFFINIR